jgi:hypothetical protein
MELHGDEVDDRSGSWTALLHAGDHAIEDRLFFSLILLPARSSMAKSPGPHTLVSARSTSARSLSGRERERERERTEAGLKDSKCSINSFFVPVSKIHVVIIEVSKTSFRLILERQGLAHGSFFVSLPINWLLPGC